jgi:hypothetical protein
MNKPPRSSFQPNKKSKHDARVKKLLEFTDEIQQIRKSYATRIAAAARDMQKAAAVAIALEQEMNDKCVALAGEGFETVHTVTYQPHGSGIDEQMESLGEVLGAGLEDVHEMARAMAESAEAHQE